MRRRVGRTLAGEGYVEVLNFPFVGEADLDRLGLDAADPRRTTLRLANPLRSEEPLHDHHAAARPAAHGRPQRQPRHQRPRPVRDGAGHAAALRRGRADPPGRPPTDRGGVGRPQQGAARTSRCTSPSPSAASATAAAGGARAGRRRWSDVIETARVVADALGPRARRAPRPAWRRGTPAGAPSSSLGETVGRSRRRAAPQGVPGLRRTRAHVGRRARPRRPAGRARSTMPQRPSSRPTRSPRRTSPSSSTPTSRRPSWPRPCAKVPVRCASRCGSSTSTPASRWARAASRSPSRCASAPPTAPSPRRRPPPPATPPSPLAVQRHGAQQRA